MDFIANILGFLAIVIVTLTGIAGLGVLTARRPHPPTSTPSTKDQTAERNTES